MHCVTLFTGLQDMAFRENNDLDKFKITIGNYFCGMKRYANAVENKAY